jgi:Spy/CpxP family protein refolding chaperone
MRRTQQRRNDVVSMFVRAATGAPDLTDEQRTKLGGLRPKAGLGALQETAEYRTAMIESVKSGKVDSAAFAKPAEAMEKAREEKRVERVARLNELHAVLTPTQRKAVADAVRGRLTNEPTAGARPPGRGVRGPEEQHKGVLRPMGRGPGNRLAGPIDSFRRDPAPGHGEVGFKGMVDGIELTPEQQKKLEELTKKTETTRPKRDEARKAALAVVDAFEKETFDAAKLELFKPGAEDATWLKTHLAHFEELLAILTEQQRGDLAKKLETGGVPPLDMPSRDELAAMSGGPEDDSRTESPEPKKAEKKPTKPVE